MDLETMELRKDDLVLRPVASTDLEELLELYGDPRVGGEMRFGVLDRVGVAELLVDYLDCWRDFGFGMWSARRVWDGAYVGEAGLRVHHRTKMPALRYATTADHWRKSYGATMAGVVLQDAFQRCELDHVDAFIRADNIASRRVGERIGMRIVDRLETDHGTVLRYQISKADWWAAQT